MATAGWRGFHSAELSSRVGPMPSVPPVVLTIAGFDPSSGAGVTADIKTIAAHECYGIACITALTVQSTQGVKRVEPVDPKVIAATLAEVASDFQIAAVHIGMMGNERAALAIAEFLGKNAFPNVVLDPILKSSSGADLLDPGGVRVMVEQLFPLSELIAPNLDEAISLTSRRTGVSAPRGPNLPEKMVSMPQTIELMREAARNLHALGAANVVVTGGHLEKAVDLLSFTTGRGVEQEVFKAERQRSNSTHGTGCAFSSALACHLAHGRGLPEAVLLSKAYVSAAISNSYPMGHGKGPLHHLYRMHQQRRPTKVVSEAETAHLRN
jgi:hydroxymethylpyrimidine/phosphomethylpyrimidine kinase